MRLANLHMCASADCLQCRVAVAPEQQLYLPMCWPVWGAKDAEHLHVNNRFDFVLYADRGLIVGGGVFPGERRPQMLVTSAECGQACSPKRLQ